MLILLRSLIHVRQPIYIEIYTHIVTTIRLQTEGPYVDLYGRLAKTLCQIEEEYTEPQ